MRGFVARYPVAVFVVLTLLAQFAVVLSAWLLIPEGEEMHDGSAGARAAHMVFRFRIFFPLVIAVSITYFLERTNGLKKLFGSFLHWRVPVKWYAMAFTWKFCLGYLGIASIVTLGWDVWPGWVSPSWLSNMLTNAVFVIALAMVEETSWIRFCVTRLQDRHGAFWSSTVIGFAWAAWYLMMMLIGEGVPDGIPWFAFITSMFSLSVLLTWAYNTTRSGTVLIIMQVFSNCAFLAVPMLPVPDRPPFFMNAFVVISVLLALTLAYFAGTEHLHRNGLRAKWSEPIH